MTTVQSGSGQNTEEQEQKDRRRRRVRLPRTRAQRVWRGVVSTTASAVAAAAVVVLVFNPPWEARPIGAPELEPSPSLSAPSGTITVPVEGTRAGEDIPAAGTLRDLPSGNTAWLIAEVVGPDDHPAWEQLRPRVQDRLWPGPEPVTLAADGTWQGVVPVSQTSTMTVDGFWLRISLVVADPTVDAAFREYNATAAQQRHPGISPLPATGLVRLDAVVVVLDYPVVIF